jgi:hypothetical protein
MSETQTLVVSKPQTNRGLEPIRSSQNIPVEQGGTQILGK